MTVGVGFQGQDFVLLCTDSEITREYGKSEECKIHILSDKNSNYPSACIYAGDVDFMKRVLPSLERVCRGEKTNLIQRLEREWAGIYKKMRRREKQGIMLPWIQMVFAIGTKTGPKLYYANLDIFRREKKFETVGIGGDVARSVIEPAYKPGASLSRPELLLLAASGVKQAKDYVRYCGKKTQILVLDGASSLFGGPYVDEIPDLEADFAFFREKSSKLLLSMANAEPDDSTFDEELDKFTKAMKARHDTQVEQEIELRKESHREDEN